MWIKICGITRPTDALAVQQAGADAIGLNFYPRSRRCVDCGTAQQIVAALQTGTAPPAPLDIVGVFVNADPLQVAETVTRCGLTAVQFHGDESAEDLQRFHQLLPRIPVVRAVRVSREQLPEVLQSLQSLQQQVPLAAVLVDALVAGEYGGTGHTVDQAVVRTLQDRPDLPRLIVAGGLTPQNVAALVQARQPWGIDTASGVESQPGLKDAALVQAFVQQARRAATAVAASAGQPLQRL